MPKPEPRPGPQQPPKRKDRLGIMEVALIRIGMTLEAMEQTLGDIRAAVIGLELQQRRQAARTARPPSPEKGHA